MRANVLMGNTKHIYTQKTRKDSLNDEVIPDNNAERSYDNNDDAAHTNFLTTKKHQHQKRAARLIPLTLLS